MSFLKKIIKYIFGSFFSLIKDILPKNNIVIFSGINHYTYNGNIIYHYLIKLFQKIENFLPEYMNINNANLPQNLIQNNIREILTSTQVL